MAARLMRHLWDKSPGHKAHWISQLRRLGLRPLITRLIGVADEYWADAERYWIAYFRQIGCHLVNDTEGGEGGSGHRHSEETRAKLRAISRRQMSSPQARAAVSRVHRGKTISLAHRVLVGRAAKRRWTEWRAAGAITPDETRRKISIRAKMRPPRPQSPETRAKISALKFALWRDDPHRRTRMSERMKGRIFSEEHRRKISESVRRAVTPELRAHLSATTSAWSLLHRRTHCRHGHEYVPENTAHTKQGARICKECHRRSSRISSMQAYRQSREPGAALAVTNHGANGYRRGCRCDVCRGARNAYKRMLQTTHQIGREAT